MTPITIDTSALTFPFFRIPEHTGESDFLDGSMGATVTFAPGIYHFQQYSGYYADFTFHITEAGLVDYSDEFARFLGGKGTKKLTVNGLPITVKVGALSHGLLFMIAGRPSALSLFEPSTTRTLVLVPASFYNFQPGSGMIGDFAFGVSLEGNVVVDSRYIGFATATSNTLTITGYTIYFDGRLLSHDLYPIFLAAPHLYSRATVQQLTLFPSNGYQFQPGPGVVADFVFRVSITGKLDYHHDCDLFVSGRDSNTIVLRGFPVVVDFTQAHDDRIDIRMAGEPGRAPLYLLAVLLPAAYPLNTSHGVIDGFLLRRNGSITVNPTATLAVSTVPRVEVH